MLASATCTRTTTLTVVVLTSFGLVPFELIHDTRIFSCGDTCSPMIPTGLFFTRLSFLVLWMIRCNLVSAIPLRQISQLGRHGAGPREQCLAHVSTADRRALEDGLLAVRSPALFERSLAASSPPLVQANQTFVFNVSFNVIYTNETDAGGWVSDTRIEKQVDILNKDFQGSGISWVLVGIQRIKSADWFVNAYPGSDQEQAMKKIFNVGDASTLNIYTMTFNSTTSSLGTAAIPSAYYRAPKSDGVMIRHGTVTGGAREHYNMGRTLTHEVGHWLGLFHTFEGGCDDGVGDNVADTPPAASGSEGCPVGRDSCPRGGPDLINNFMDYSYDECMTSFTKGQTLRMREAAWAFRRPGGKTAPPVKA